MSYNLLAVSLSGKVLSSVFFSLALLLYKLPPGEEGEVKLQDKYDEKDKNRLSVQNANKTQSVDTLTTSVNDEAFTGSMNGDVNDNRTESHLKGSITDSHTEGDNSYRNHRSALQGNNSDDKTIEDGVVSTL